MRGEGRFLNTSSGSFDIWHMLLACLLHFSKVGKLRSAGLNTAEAGHPHVYTPIFVIFKSRLQEFQEQQRTSTCESCRMLGAFDNFRMFTLFVVLEILEVVI